MDQKLQSNLSSDKAFDAEIKERTASPLKLAEEKLAKDEDTTIPRHSVPNSPRLLGLQTPSLTNFTGSLSISNADDTSIQDLGEPDRFSYAQKSTSSSEVTFRSYDSTPVQSLESYNPTRLIVTGRAPGANRCPYLDCKRLSRDLKAHMLTHQDERPEKRPVTSCEYHDRGFAQEHDRYRHTLTHFQEEIICGFYPQSDESVEESFSKIDVFKRHLESVHADQENTPNNEINDHNRSFENSRLSKLLTGICPTCPTVFRYAEDLLWHIEPCAIYFMRQEKPEQDQELANGTM